MYSLFLIGPIFPYLNLNTNVTSLVHFQIATINQNNATFLLPFKNQRGSIVFCLDNMLWSVVGMAHVLRSRLVMDYTTSYFPLIVLGYPLDSKQSDGP